ncbi:SET domain-containing protein [Sphingomonas bacterium]|uniref:SET domain-containing protein n=1 Tax=Sphingomonas bacterium TaxID=1895847 RepID=UPI0015775CB0|nr:SET domain-containing protein [Sphingomonas bacterium]
MTIQAWLIGAMGLSLAGYGTYLVGLRRHLVEPNRASWLIWAAAAGVEAATYAAVNPHQPQSWVFAASAIACITVTLSMWRRSRWGAPTPTESLCMGAALAALLLWVAFKETFWAHMLVVAAVPISFWPTWQSVMEDRARERSPAWGLWTLGDLTTLLLAARAGDTGIGGLAYILVEFACHASVWFMIGLATINPLRSLGLGRGGLVVLDALSPANPFAVGETHLGKAVFAARPFAEGERIVRFSGRRISAARLGRRLEGTGDRFVQVAPDEYMGPSGRIDDLINHSCSPNAGLRFEDDGVFLIAIQPIAPGEEIAWDYATTLADPDWRLPCDCRSAICRGTIAAFATLPAERQDWYLERGIVAPYLRPAAVPARERAA